MPTTDGAPGETLVVVNCSRTGGADGASAGSCLAIRVRGVAAADVLVDDCFTIGADARDGLVATRGVVIAFLTAGGIAGVTAVVDDDCSAAVDGDACAAEARLTRLTTRAVVVATAGAAAAGLVTGGDASDTAGGLVVACVCTTAALDDDRPSIADGLVRSASDCLTTGTAVVATAGAAAAGLATGGDTSATEGAFVAACAGVTVGAADVCAAAGDGGVGSAGDCLTTDDAVDDTLGVVDACEAASAIGGGVDDANASAEAGAPRTRPARISSATLRIRPRRLPVTNLVIALPSYPAAELQKPTISSNSSLLARLHRCRSVQRLISMGKSAGLAGTSQPIAARSAR